MTRFEGLGPLELALGRQALEMGWQARWLSESALQSVQSKEVLVGRHPLVLQVTVDISQVLPSDSRRNIGCNIPIREVAASGVSLSTLSSSRPDEVIEVAAPKFKKQSVSNSVKLNYKSSEGQKYLRRNNWHSGYDSRQGLLRLADGDLGLFGDPFSRLRRGRPTAF